MPVIANSIVTTIRDAQGFGAGTYPSPFHMHGYLAASLSFYTGGALSLASGRLSPVAAGAAGVPGDLAAAANAGILGSMGPRRQAIEPLTSNTAPAAALPGQYTTPADPAVLVIGEFGSFEESHGVEFMAAMPGNVFEGHLVTVTNAGDGGVDLTAVITQLGSACNVTATAASGTGEAEFVEETGLALTSGVPDGLFFLGGQLTNSSYRIVGFRNPQPLSWLTSTTFTVSPGPCVISGTAAAINPVVQTVAILSPWM